MFIGINFLCWWWTTPSSWLITTMLVWCKKKIDKIKVKHFYVKVKTTWCWYYFSEAGDDWQRNVVTWFCVNILTSRSIPDLSLTYWSLIGQWLVTWLNTELWLVSQAVTQWDHNVQLNLNWYHLRLLLEAEKSMICWSVVIIILSCHSGIQPSVSNYASINCLLQN